MPVVNGLFNVVVAWDKGADEEKTRKMESFFVKTLTQRQENGFATDEEHITFLNSKEDVDGYVVEGKCDALIVSESLGGTAIGTGAIKAWKSAGRDMKIILVMNNNKKGSGKAQGLYKLSYYRGLFIEDFNPSSVFELLCNNRAPMDAFEYYGVGYVRDRNEYSAKKQADDLKDTDAVSSSVKEKSGMDNEDTAPEKKGRADKKAEKKADKKADKLDKSQKSEKAEKKNAEKQSKKDSKKKAKEAAKTVKESHDEKLSAAQKVAAEVVKEKESERQAGFDELLAEGEGYFEDAMAEGYDSYLGVEDADQGLSGYADIPETEDAGDTDDSSAFDLLIPADFFEQEMDVSSALSGSDEDALAFIRARECEAFAPSDIQYEPNRVGEICETVLTHYTLEDPTNMSNLEAGLMSKDEFDYELNRYLEGFEADEETLEQVKAEFYEFMHGYDIITPFINDPTISDIKLEAPNRIRIKRKGKRYFSKVVFRSENHYKSFISHIARKNFVNLQDGKPDKTFMDTTTSEFCRMRFVLSTEYISSNNFPTLVIRKIPNQKYTVEQLVNAGMMTPKTAAFLVDEVRKGKSFLVTGSMASGKTTWMNTFLDFISHDKSILAIQENEELFSNVHPDTMFQRIQVSDDGELTYDLRYLSTFGLLMDVDYFMVGELKGPESKQFVDAVYTNTICWASLHCPSSRDALPRVADMAKFDSDYSVEALLERLAAGIDYVIFLEKFQVKELSRVKGFDRKTKEVIYEDVELW